MVLRRVVAHLAIGACNPSRCVSPGDKASADRCSLHPLGGVGGEWGLGRYWYKNDQLRTISDGLKNVVEGKHFLMDQNT